MIEFFNFVLIIIALLLFVRPVQGVCLLIAYMFLIPAMEFRLGGIVLDANVLILGYSLILIIRYFNQLKKISYKPFLYFFFLFFILLVLTFLSTGRTPLSFSVLYYIRNTVRYALFPALIYAIVFIEPQAFNSIKNTLIVVYSVILLYGVALLLTPGINPYMTLMTLAYNMDDLSKNYVVEGSGRLFGRITSVFPHSMEFGCVLGVIVFSLIYFYKQKNVSFIIFIVLMVLSFVCIVISGTRTPIASLMVATGIYIVSNHSFKLFFKLFVPFVLILIVLSFFPDVFKYVFSIFESDTSDYGGSSMEQRITQLTGCFNEISKNPLFGNGYQWHANYLYLKGGHPEILAWESIWFVALTDSGLVGVLVWGLFILKSCMYLKDKFFITFFLYFICYMSITGEFGMASFGILYAVMLAHAKLRKRELIIQRIKIAQYE